MLDAIVRPFGDRTVRPPRDLHLDRDERAGPLGGPGTPESRDPQAALAAAAKLDLASVVVLLRPASLAGHRRTSRPTRSWSGSSATSPSSTATAASRGC